MRLVALETTESRLPVRGHVGLGLGFPHKGEGA